MRSRGGRVLTFTAKGETLDEARERAYSDVDRVHFPYMQYRKDIGEDTDTR
ncbi:MAG: phosphoribosylglycinamide synthetase C domain-containing protein [Candidatus Aenigmatarchaeota archaeon]